MPERVENNPSAFAAGQFGSRHEIAVSSNQNDGIGLLFQSNGSNINPDSHIHRLLLKSCLKIFVSKI